MQRNMTSTQMMKVNLVVMGDQYSGKSSLVQRFAHGTFGPSYIQTRGTEYYKKTIRIKDVTVNLYVYDTAGQVNMKTVIKSIYRKAQGILLVFDFSRRETLEHIKEWIDLVRAALHRFYKVCCKSKFGLIKEYIQSRKTCRLEKHCDVEPELLLAGNKIDLTDTHRNISTTDARLIADHNNVEFIAVSAKRNINVEKAFENLTNKVYRNREKFFIKTEESIRLHNYDLKDESSCCDR